MKKRIAYISLYFFTVLLIFILQKPYFGCRAYFYHFCGRYGIIHILGI